MPIIDQGYQHWQGSLSGHAWRWLAITRQGVRAHLRSWLVRLLLLAAWVPAVALTAAVAVWGLLEQRATSVLTFLNRLLPAALVEEPEAYRQAVWTIAWSFFFKVELFIVLFLALLVGQGLISRDLRFNALPLYLSRPVRRIDYFLGKLGIIGFFVAAVVFVPATIAYVLGVCFSLDLSVIRDTHKLLWGSLAYSAAITLSAGTLMLALSSLSRRSLYVGLLWIGFWLVGASVSGILVGIQAASINQDVINRGMSAWASEHPPPEGIQMFGPWPSFRPVPGGRGRGGGRGMSPEQERWYQEWSQELNRLQAEAEKTHHEASRRDWRPLCSYGNSLGRMGDLFLNTDGAWVVIGKAVERPRAFLGGRRGGVPTAAGGGERLFADRMVWQYPWWWSASVLVGLLGLSVWILSSRVKSLDRLR
jgi:ABC-type transport system involved in multi-copper enzyme maturation permease subunit